MAYLLEQAFGRWFMFFFFPAEKVKEGSSVQAWEASRQKAHQHPQTPPHLPSDIKAVQCDDDSESRILDP